MSILYPDIPVGPPMVVISNGFTVLSTEPDGQIAGDTEKGLYFRDTRLISSYSIMVNGERWGAPQLGCRHLLRVPALPDQSTFRR